MSFLRPEYLWGLLALAIPVIIHLINFRRPEKLAFSTLSFFEELRRTTVRKLRFKQYLLLFARLLFITLLVLALARPVLWNDGQSLSPQTGEYVLVLDNSASMSRIDAEGPMIEQAKNVLKEIINQSSDNARFLLLTTHGSPIPLQFRDARQTLTLLEDVETVARSENFSAVWQQLTSASGYSNRALNWFWAGDRTEAWHNYLSQEIESAPVDLWNMTYIDIAGNQFQNVAVSDLSLQNQMVSMGRPAFFDATVTNFGDQPVANFQLSMRMNERLVGQETFSLDAGASQTMTFEVSVQQSGDQRVTLSVSGDPVEYDNEFHAVLTVPNRKKIGIITDQQPGQNQSRTYFDAFADAANNITGELELTSLSPDDATPGNLDDYDALVLNSLEEIPAYLNEFLGNYTERGGGLILIPSQNLNLESWNQLLNRLRVGNIRAFMGDYGSFEEISRISPPDVQHPVFQGMFDADNSGRVNIEEPAVYYQLQLGLSGSGFNNTLLRTSNNYPVLIESRTGNGRVLTFTIGLEPAWSTLPANAFFAPLIYRSLYYASASSGTQLSSDDLDNPFTYTASFSNSTIQITTNNDNTIKPDVRTLLNSMTISYSGYELTPGFINLSDGTISRLQALNISDYESVLQKIDLSALESDLKELFNSVSVVEQESSQITSQQQTIFAQGFGREIWSWFLMFSLIVLLGEQFITRFYKA
jgi:hypothetical protein